MLIKEQMRKYKVKMEEISQLEAAESIAFRRLSLLRQNAVSGGGGACGRGLGRAWSYAVLLALLPSSATTCLARGLTGTRLGTRFPTSAKRPPPSLSLLPTAPEGSRGPGTRLVMVRVIHQPRLQGKLPTAEVAPQWG